MNIIDLIPSGKENAVSRKSLAAQLGVSDRMARDLIHEARKKYPILSNTNSGGYYLPETKDEAREFINVQLSYIASINSNIAAVKRYMENKGQVKINDLEREGLLI